MKKIIFLDIDGVLNSYRSVHAFGDYPNNESNHDKFDHVAVGLIRTVCKKCNAEIILSSRWRLFSGWENLEDVLDLPIIGRTPALLSGSRGQEIAMWLRDNVVFDYVIVDDDSDMLESQKENFVQVDMKEGLSFKNYEQILKILGIEDEN